MSTGKEPQKDLKGEGWKCSKKKKKKRTRTRTWKRKKSTTTTTTTNKQTNKPSKAKKVRVWGCN